MKQGFVKVAAASCAVAVADVRENTRVILETIHKMEDEGAKVMVLPELALTGYTCSDLFWQSQMIDAAKESLLDPDKTIGQVAGELGFQYPQHFSRLFKKNVGCTPNEYKQQN